MQTNTNQLGQAVEEIFYHSAEEHTGSREKFRVTVKLNNKPLNFELDSEAAVIVIGEP